MLHTVHVIKRCFKVFFTVNLTCMLLVFSAIEGVCMSDQAGNYGLLESSEKETGISSSEQDTTAAALSPRGAMFRSLVFPGWGQWYNEKKLKSLLVFSAEAACVVAYRNEDSRMKNSTSESEREYYRDERNKYAWWLGGVIIYSMLDAYVDAYLDKFNVRMDINVDKKEDNTLVMFTLNFSPDRLFHRRK